MVPQNMQNHSLTLFKPFDQLLLTSQWDRWLCTAGEWACDSVDFPSDYAVDCLICAYDLTLKTAHGDQIEFTLHQLCPRVLLLLLRAVKCTEKSKEVAVREMGATEA